MMCCVVGWTEEELNHFWNCVDKSGDCWIHKGAPSSSGYSQCFSSAKGVQNSHRVAYEFFFGQIPKGYLVRHACNNKRCVRPDHLKRGTHANNMQDVSDAQSHPKRKLTQEQAREIRQSSDSQRTLADRFGVDQAAIGNIKSGRTYRELGEPNDRSATVINFGRKNTPKEVIEQIRGASGTYKEIAAKHGVSFSFVGRIKRGEVCKAAKTD